MRHTTTTDAPVDALQPWERAAKLFPRYSEEQIRELNRFQARHGEDAILPLVVSPDFKIVDGYNRWAAAKERGETTMTVHVYAYADEAEMEIHAIVLNAKRRHLDAVSAARAAARLEELYKPRQVETKAKRSEFMKGNQNASNNKNSCTPPGVQLFHRKSSLERAAKEVGVSQSTVRAVKKIDSTKDAELISAMEKKEISIEKAAKLAEVPQETRQMALKAELQAGNARLEKVRDAFRDEGACAFVAGCVDAQIRLKQGRERTDLPKLTQEQLITCVSALAGVLMLIKELKEELDMNRKGDRP